MRLPGFSGLVLYDDSCGFCRRWIPFWGRALARRGFEIEPLQAGRLPLTDAELLQDLRLLLPDGRQVVGADVYRYVMRRIWWAYPLSLVAGLPPFRQLFDAAYLAFANNRFWISQTCGLRAKVVVNEPRRA
jgi:predicted DCC family thiol-disulfide oxidoreductase YuxK